MARTCEYLTLSLALILAFYALSVLGSANAQTITKPSTPEFTAEYFDFSYDVAPVYGIDPNTDETILKIAGYHVDNRSIQFTIKNQPFTPFTDPSSGRTIDLFYNIKYRPSFWSSWTSLFGGERSFYAGTSGDPNFDPYIEFGYPIQNYSAQYTTITFIIPSNIPSIGLDFQVQALEGYTNHTRLGETHIFYAAAYYSFHGEKSDWSNMQTAPLAYPSPTVQEYSLLILLPLLTLIPLIILLRKRSRSKANNRSAQYGFQ